MNLESCLIFSHYCTHERVCNVCFARLSGDQLHGGIDTTIANEPKTHGHSPIMNEAS